MNGDELHLVVRRLYESHADPSFFATALRVVATALRSRHAYVVVRDAPHAEPRVAATLGVGAQLVRQAGLGSQAFCRQLNVGGVHELAALGRLEAQAVGRPGFEPLGVPFGLLVGARHGPRPSSLWAFGLAFRPDEQHLSVARILAANLGYAGDIALRLGALVGDRPLASASASESSPPAALPAARGRLPEPPLHVAEAILLAARGYSAKEIAGALDVSMATVSRRLSEGYKLLGVSGRHALPAADILHASWS